MGKFSKPRNSEWYQDDFRSPIPVPPASKPEVPAPPAKKPEFSAAPAEEFQEEVIPEAPEDDYVTVD